MSDEVDPLSATEVTDAGSAANTSTAPSVAHGATPVGERIGKFIVERKLGAGAMGVVYAARDPELDRQVAIKLIRTGSRIGGLEARLFREAQALARVAHPNVVVVHEVGRHGDQVFVAMELVRGTTLREWMEQPHEVADILRMLGEAGRGLAAAHAAELVHRDFKPDNVLIGEDGRARVTDFGLARAQGDDDEPRTGTPVTSPLHEALTQTGMMVGTPVYASPEQLAGDRVGPATDQFAFCVTAFEALYGVRPFDGATLTELRANVDGNKVVAVGAKSDRVPRRVHAAILRGLSPRPEDRFPSMDALLAELAPEPGRAGGKRVWILGGGLIAAAGVAVAAVALTRSPPASDPPVASPCADAAAPVTAVWNDRVSQELRQAFLATKSPHAETLYRSAAAWYTNYAKELGAARQAVCARHGSNQPDETTRTANACLDVRLTRFKNNVAMNLKVTLTARVQTFLSFLDPVATCLRDRFDAPDRFDHVTQMRMGLLGALQAFLQGQTAAAHAAVDTVLAQAEAFGYAPMRAEVFLVRATFAATQNDRPTVEAALRSALTAAESAGDDRSKTQAATRIADLLLGRNQLDEAAHMVDLAVAALARFGPDVSVEPDVLYVRGRLAAARKQDSEAIALLEQAITLSDANSSLSGDAVLALAAIYKALGRTADEEKLRARFANARVNLDMATAGASKRVELRQACNVDLSAPETDLEKAHARCAATIPEIEKAGDIGDEVYAEAHWMTGGLLELLDREREAAAHYERAAKAFDGLKIQLSIALTREGAGRSLLSLKDFAGALVQYEAALAAATQTGAEGRERVALATAGIGRALVGLERFAEAIPKLDDALARMAKVDDPLATATAVTRFALAKARWGRNASGDRADAKLDAGIAQRTLRKFLDDLKPTTEMTRRNKKWATTRLAEIDAWVASH